MKEVKKEMPASTSANVIHGQLTLINSLIDHEITSSDQNKIKELEALKCVMNFYSDVAIRYMDYDIISDVVRGQYSFSYAATMAEIINLLKRDGIDDFRSCIKGLVTLNTPDELDVETFTIKPDYSSKVPFFLEEFLISTETFLVIYFKCREGETVLHEREWDNLTANGNWSILEYFITDHGYDDSMVQKYGSEFKEYSDVKIEFLCLIKFLHLFLAIKMSRMSPILSNEQYPYVNFSNDKEILGLIDEIDIYSKTIYEDRQKPEVQEAIEYANSLRIKLSNLTKSPITITSSIRSDVKLYWLERIQSCFEELVLAEPEERKWFTDLMEDDNKQTAISFHKNFLEMVNLKMLKEETLSRSQQIKQQLTLDSSRSSINNRLSMSFLERESFLEHMNRKVIYKLTSMQPDIDPQFFEDKKEIFLSDLKRGFRCMFLSESYPLARAFGYPLKDIQN